MDIYGKLVYVGLDIEGNIHLYIRKDNGSVISKIIEVLNLMKDKDVFIRIKLLR